MRKFFSAVAVATMFVGLTACSGDATGPNAGPQFSHNPKSVGDSTVSNQCLKTYVRPAPLWQRCS